METRAQKDIDDSASNAIIAVNGLHKHYGQVRAVDGIDFSVAEGEIFGLLGHNGAGKTTTIRMLTGRTRPSQGRASVAGHDVVNELDRIKPLINLVFEEPNLYERLSGRENLAFFSRLYDIDPTRIDELLNTVGLTDAAGRKIKTYSSGMKQRLLIARALLNQPKVLFLDEPTRGLDPTSAREIRQLLARTSAAGTTLFLTTHYMEEADQLCHRVAFLAEGKIVALDTPRELKLKYGTRTALVVLDDRQQHTIRLEAWMQARRVLTIHSQEGTLEDVFIELAGRAL